VKNLLLSFLLLISFLNAEQKDNLEIGFVYWKKANAPEKYNAYVYGINKAIQEINEKGGLEGHPLKLVLFNEKGKVEESIKIAKEIAKRKKMIAVIGFSNSNRALKAIKYVSEANIPIISSAGSRKIFSQDKNGVFFTTNFGIKGETLYLEKFIKAKGYKNFIFISKKGDTYSDEYFNYVSKILKSNGKFTLEDFNNNLQKIRNSILKDTLIIISINVADNAKYSFILRNIGIKNDIFLGRGGIVGSEFYEAGGYGLKNIYELSTLLAGVSNETIQEFEEKNRDYFKNEKNKRYLEYATYGYDVINLIMNAYYRAAYKDVDDPKLIREIIKHGLLMITEKNPYDGIATTYSFDKNRIGGKLTPQYILESTGKKPSLYKKQYIYQNGVLKYVPTLYTNIDIKSITINSQEASEYTFEMMITLISEQDIGLDDLEFENIVISDSSFKPSIYSKEFIVSSHDDTEKKENLKIKTYYVKALYSWDNTIEDFPFDSQKLPILIKPKDPIHKNFINFFISDINQNLNKINISGWQINGGYAGFKKGNYEYIGPDLEKKKEYYYRSSFTVNVTRKALSSAVKFILPLMIVLFITIILFALPDKAAGDKVGSATNMLITVAALYFTYATLVEVDYLTFVDWLYMGSLGFVLLANVLFILRQRFYQEGIEIDENTKYFDKPCFSGPLWLGIDWLRKQHPHCKKVSKYNFIYYASFWLSVLAFILAITYFIHKANF
jgi:ABC-type branched-subunit amino acid transport system substrate-binding protein